MEEKRNKNGLTEKEFLAQYNPGNYERPSVTVDMLIFSMDEKLDKLKLLLIQRKDHPYIDCFAFPGGFIDMTESAYEAAARELNEETGLTGIYLEQLYTMSQPERDPRMRIIDIAYMALIPCKEVVAGDDAKEALWFDVTFTDDKLMLDNNEKDVHIEYNLEKKVFENGKIKIENLIPILVSEEKLAFDHADTLLEGLSRLRNKVLYSDVAFNLVPDEFTLPDLQKVYEIILGKKLYKTNFRDSIKDKIEETGNKLTSMTCNRASKGYVYKQS